MIEIPESHNLISQGKLLEALETLKVEQKGIEELPWIQLAIERATFLQAAFRKRVLHPNESTLFHNYLSQYILNKIANPSHTDEVDYCSFPNLNSFIPNPLFNPLQNLWSDKGDEIEPENSFISVYISLKLCFEAQRLLSEEISRMSSFIDSYNDSHKYLARIKNYYQAKISDYSLLHQRFSVLSTQQKENIKYSLPKPYLPILDDFKHEILDWPQLENWEVCEGWGAGFKRIEAVIGSHPLMDSLCEMNEDLDRYQRLGLIPRVTFFLKKIQFYFHVLHFFEVKLKR